MTNSKSTLIPLLFIFLFLAAVPWYWQWFPDFAHRIVLGMPLWSFSAVFFSFLISLLTCWMFCQPWPEELEDQPRSGNSSSDDATPGVTNSTAATPTSPENQG